jgi:outer membrane protein, multidrug efflux system
MWLRQVAMKWESSPFTAGSSQASYLDELDAQRTLFNTQLSVVSVKNTLLLAQIDLYRALGGGWKG